MLSVNDDVRDDEGCGWIKRIFEVFDLEIFLEYQVSFLYGGYIFYQS